MVGEILGLGESYLLENAGLAGVIVLSQARSELNDTDIEQARLFDRRQRNNEVALLRNNYLIDSTTCTCETQDYYEKPDIQHSARLLSLHSFVLAILGPDAFTTLGVLFRESGFAHLFGNDVIVDDRFDIVGRTPCDFL